MPVQQNQSLYHSLRKKYPFFSFDDFKVIKSADQLQIKYRFNLSDLHIFEPTLTIPAKSFINFSINEDLLENLAFHIGMVELVSYWKAACPPKVFINPAFLDKTQVDWFKKLYFNGLGEFFYLNGITPDFDDFMTIEVRGDWDYQSVCYQPEESVLVPVGGGKDSAVTLDLVDKGGFKVLPFILNPRKASLETSRAAGYAEQDIVVFYRTLDQELLRLNENGFLNGHTPFSALIAFITLLAAAMTNSSHIALSNESSANEPTIPGTNINHQYSKSILFEEDFRSYVNQYVSQSANYFSLLRPLNELQIGKIFSGLSHQFSHFKSCNAGSKTDSWCCKCSKCLFTWIILSPFIEENMLKSIFGANLMHDESLLPIFQQLTGIADEKPFECVGTIDEVNTALTMTIRKNRKLPLPYLLDYYSSTNNFAQFQNDKQCFLLNNLEKKHFVPDQFLKILKEAVK
ncbi:MAG: hypothetical protein IH598_11910 [Bacteroidales bacterium]|nr:hypothetical protein [Bacteroidales bacterium]